MAGVLFEEKEDILIITLNRPDRLNSLDTETLGAIHEKITAQKQDPKTILLTANGRVFSAGIDLAEVASANTPEEASKPFRALGKVLEALISYPAPTLSYIHAPAIAGGGELALATDIIIVAPKARLEWPEVKWNIVAPMLTSLAARLGTSRLAAMALVGERVSGEQAYQLGIAAYMAESFEEALNIAVKVDKLYRRNREAFSKMISQIREWKAKAVREVLPQLEELSSNVELVERARKFIEKR